uniref:Uncharacterized protein n=1 Tax=Setaria viridis TaxID=4556 RepID=A0A4U6T4D9_SETVI|nr:hypothetical protein SEVIR_9G352600v2 [Setaria viridis]
MADDETARYIMEQIIAGDGSGDNVPLSYIDEEGTQADMFLNMSADGNEEQQPQQQLAVKEGSGEPSGSTQGQKTRGRTKVMEGRLVITEVTEEGRPVAPEKVAKKYVSQIGAIVRDNVPISIREWKGRSTNPYALPETEKNMLWEDVKRHFTFPKGYSEKDVKAWTLKKMATQFQTFKKMLDTHYIKKGKTPDFNAWPKLRDHWDAFVEYKRSEEGVKKIMTNTANAS